MWRKYFFGINCFFPSSKEVFLHNFRQFLENLNFWRKFNGRGPYKNSENLVLSQIVLKKIYFGINCLFPSSKKCFSTILGNFWKIEFWRKFDRRRPYKNSENLVLSQIVLRKYFLAKLFVPFIKRSVSPQFKALFGKLNFWWKFDRRGPLQKYWKFSTISNWMLRKYFWQNYLFLSSKKCFSTILGNFSEIWIFDRNLTGADLTKIVKI